VRRKEATHQHYQASNIQRMLLVQCSITTNKDKRPAKGSFFWQVRAREKKRSEAGVTQTSLLKMPFA
jgi:hypothetical protein